MEVPGSWSPRQMRFRSPLFRARNSAPVGYSFKPLVALRLLCVLTAAGLARHYPLNLAPWLNCSIGRPPLLSIHESLANRDYMFQTSALAGSFGHRTRTLVFASYSELWPRGPMSRSGRKPINTTTKCQICCTRWQLRSGKSGSSTDQVANGSSTPYLFH